MMEGLARRTRRPAISIRALSPEYLTRRHSTKWNLACIVREFRVTGGTGHGDDTIPLIQRRIEHLQKHLGDDGFGFETAA